MLVTDVGDYLYGIEMLIDSLMTDSSHYIVTNITVAELFMNNVEI